MEVLMLDHCFQIYRLKLVHISNTNIRLSCVWRLKDGWINVLDQGRQNKDRVKINKILYLGLYFLLLFLVKKINVSSFIKLGSNEAIRPKFSSTFLLWKLTIDHRKYRIARLKRDLIDFWIISDNGSSDHRIIVMIVVRSDNLSLYRK